MNIAFTYPSPFNPTLGGVERVTDVLCREFQQRGHQVFYFHHRDAEKYQDFTPPAKAVFAASEDFTSAAAVESYHRFLRENNIEVVINQCGMFSDSMLYNNVHCAGISPPLVISVFHGNPLLNYDYLFNHIASLRNRSFIEHFKRFARCMLYPWTKKLYFKIRQERTKFALNNSDALILLSENYSKSINLMCGEDYPQDRLFTIPNPLPPMENDNSNSSRKWLLYVGRLDYNSKRPDRLLRIWNHLYRKCPEWEFHIVGDGPYRFQLAKQAHNLPRVFIHGWQNPEYFYKQSKICLLTSNYEGFGMVLIEAMAHGVVPILFNSYAAAKDIIDDERDGILIKPFKISLFAKKTQMLMCNEQYLSYLSRNALNKSKKWDVRYIVDKWENIIQHLIRRKTIGD